MSSAQPEIIDIEIGRLKKADWNYKKNDDRIMSKLINNIKRNGQIENIVVRQIGDGFEIINGNHRYDALVALKIESVKCISVGEISEQDSRRLAIELNETRYKSDEAILASVLKQLTENFSDIYDTITFTEKEVKAKVDVDVLLYNPEMFNIAPEASKPISRRLVYEKKDEQIVQELKALSSKYKSFEVKKK